MRLMKNAITLINVKMYLFWHYNVSILFCVILITQIHGKM